MARHFIVYCVSCFAFVLAAGCGDQAQSPLEEVKSEISRMPSFVHEKRWPTKSFYAMLQRQISELSKEARLKAFNFFEDILETVVINDTNLSERQQAFDVYFDVVKAGAAIFAKELEHPESAWEFLVSAIDVFDGEHETVSASTFNPHIPSSGLCIDKEQYLFTLEAKRSQIVAEWFEHGAFCRFFWRLPIDEQRRWLSWLDFMARRKVDIRNPANPSETAGLRFLRLPPRIPKFVVEKRGRKKKFSNTTRALPAISSDDDL